MRLDTPWRFYALVGICFLVVFWLLRRVTDSVFGRTLLAIRENEGRARAVGYDTRALKLAVFALSGAVTALAGAFHALMTGIAPLSNIEYHTSEMILVMTVIGGTGNLYASVLGAAFYVLVSDWLSTLWPRWLMLLGLLLIGVSLFMHKGLWGLGERVWNARRGAGRFVASGASMNKPILDATGIVKRYGKFTALAGVDLRVMPGTVHSVIGPNGAGKTTLFHALTGTVPASGGRIVFDGHDVTREPDNVRVRRGIARSFQVTSLFANLDVRENLRLAAQGAHASGAFDMWHRPRPRRRPECPGRQPAGPPGAARTRRRCRGRAVARAAAAPGGRHGDGRAPPRHLPGRAHLRHGRGRPGVHEGS